MEDTRRNEKILTALLAWYDRYKRDLPWRQTTDPYHIWVSEILAQQTRITALLPYYRRFVGQFPTVEALAAAQEDDVLKAWEGLGYYARAKNLQKAAGIVTTQYYGRLPDSFDALVRLPGIGAYTAGAILSIAFEQAVPAVDGNVLRVFARVEDDDIDIVTPKAKEKATAFVAGLMNEMAAKGQSRAGALTQALMELGALVCLPKTPRCIECPLAQVCRGRQAGREGALPVKTAKRPPKEMAKTVLVVCNQDGAILMRQRTERLLSGLWEFVLLDGDMNAANIGPFLEQQGLRLLHLTPMGEARHVFTHMIWQMKGFLCRVEANPPVEGYIWQPQEDLTKLALPGALRFFVQSIMKTP